MKSSIQDVLGGHAEAMVADVASSGQLVRQGKLRMIMVPELRRLLRSEHQRLGSIVQEIGLLPE